MPAQGYYDAEFNPWAQGMRRIGTMIAAQPVMQSNAQLRQQQAQTEAAQAEHYRAGTGKLTAETTAIQQDTGGRTQLSQALKRLSANPKDPAALADAFEGTALALRHDPDGTTKALGTMLGQLKALGGDIAGAADVTDPVAMEKNRADNTSKEKMARESGYTLQPGAGRFDAQGNKIASQPSGASQQTASYEETATEYPAVAGTEAVEPSTTGSLWWKKEVPGKPAIPGTPARTVKTRRRIGDAADAPMADQAQDANDSELPAVDQPGPEEQGEPTAAQAAPVTPAAPDPVASAPSYKVQNKADIDLALKEANDAINGTGAYQGKPRSKAAVLARLKAMGIQLKE